MSVTTRDIITLALKQVGILGVGQTPLAEDTNDAFVYLQNMIAQWNKNRWLVPSLTRHHFTGTSQKSYSVGIGGDIDIPRPSDIKGAYIVQLNTGSTPVSLPVEKIFAFEDFIRISVPDLNTLPDYFFYDGQYPLANLYLWPIPNTQYEIYFLAQSELGFGTTITDGAITTPGAGYVTANYTNVALTGGSGTGATADITVTGGVVAVVNLDTGGQNYAVNDVLSANNLDLGGSGAGFTYTVGDTGPNIDTIVSMPPEYQRALIFNLAVELSGMYQVEPTVMTVKIAKAALNVLRKNNTQVPRLTMPTAPGLKRGKSFNIYNADGL